jgi:hypothetical protein
MASSFEACEEQHAGGQNLHNSLAVCSRCRPITMPMQQLVQHQSDLAIMALVGVSLPDSRLLGQQHEEGSRNLHIAHLLYVGCVQSLRCVQQLAQLKPFHYGW